MSERKKVNRKDVFMEIRHKVPCPNCGLYVWLDDYDACDDIGNCIICEEEFDIID